MRALFLLFVAALFASPAAAADFGTGDYEGPDAGYLLTALAAGHDADAIYEVDLSFRKRDRSDSGELHFILTGGLLKIPTRVDFSTPDEKGAVLVRRLPAGDYELFHVHEVDRGSRFDVNFSLPFTIKAAQTTYLGDFRPLPLFEKRSSFQNKATVGFYFFLSDRSDRDLPIARRKIEGLPPAADFKVPSPAELNVPLFRSSAIPFRIIDRDGTAALASGKSAYESGNDDVAIAQLTEAISSRDLWPYSRSEAYRYRGLAEFRRKRDAEAIGDFNAALAIDPFAAGTYSDRGAVYAAMADYDRALADETKAVAVGTDEAEYRKARARILMTAKRYRDAVRDLDEAVRLAPDDMDILMERAAAYGALGDFDKAAEDAGRAIERKPLAWRYRRTRGALLLAAGRFEDAYADFEKLIFWGQGTAEDYVHRCYARAMMGKPGDALDDCDRAATMDTASATPHYTRGLVDFKMGRYEAAVADYSDALRLEPDDARARYARGIAEIRAGNRAAGESDIEDAQARDAAIAAEMARLEPNPT